MTKSSNGVKHLLRASEFSAGSSVRKVQYDGQSLENKANEHHSFRPVISQLNSSSKQINRVHSIGEISTIDVYTAALRAALLRIRCFCLPLPR